MRGEAGRQGEEGETNNQAPLVSPATATPSHTANSAARTIARMPALVASDRLAQASITIRKSVSARANCAASVPVSVPPVSESAVLP